MDFGFESSFSGFEVEMQDTQAKKVAKYDRVFSIKEGGGSVFIKPLVAKDILYFGASDNYIYAFNTVTHKGLWRFKTGGPIIVGLEFHDGVLYVGSYDGYLYAIDASKGREIWRFKTGGKIACIPLFYSNSVIFGSRDGYFYRLSLKGKEIWKFKTGDDTSFSPVAHEDKIFVGSYDKNLYCLNLETGREIWRFRCGGELACLPRCPIRNGVIYITSVDNHAYAISIETGREIWRFKYGEHGGTGAPEMLGDKMYIGSRDNYLICLDMNGKELWRFRAGSVVDGCIIRRGIAYFGSDDYRIYAIDAETGKKIWTFRTGGECFMMPEYHNGKVYLGSADCKLYCLDAMTGEASWIFQTSSNMKSQFAPLYDEYKVEIKHGAHIEDAISEDRYKKKKGEETVSLSDYHVASEYSTASDYKQKGDYDTSFVIFEDVMEGEQLWISDSRVLTPNLKTLK